MNILILNWRDIKNPNFGGAEILTHEIAKRWVKLGHKVTLFSSVFPSSKKEEVVDGVKFVRQGYADARFLFSSVHFQAYRFYRKNPGKFDVIVDEIHGLPFFTPWYVKEKKIAFICEVAGDLWPKMFGPFFGLIGRLLEHFYLRFIYKNISFLTISTSTQNELLREGVRKKNITVLPMGITIPKEIKKTQKEKNPTLIFVGRLSKSKGIEDAILAMKQVSKIYLKAKLWIVGTGEENYVKFLKEMAKKLNISSEIIFWGYVSEEKKFELMGKAHVLLAPSLKEGWGLIVPEAAYVGTPSIVYNVQGLKDIVVNGVNGVVVKANNKNEIYKEVINILTNKNFYIKIKSNAKKSSLNYNWDKTAEIALKTIKIN